MAWSFSAHMPVYLQIAERISKRVISGEYSLGEQLPSVRQLAIEAAVNPNTVQRAYSTLEEDGIIKSRGTLGRFVTDDAEVVENCRKKLLLNIVKEFAENVSQISATREQIIAILEEVMENEHTSV